MTISFEVRSRDGKRVVRVSSQGRAFSSRLYVNGGETATLVTAKAQTEAGARKQAAKMLGETPFDLEGDKLTRIDRECRGVGMRAILTDGQSR
jgi:hypothetical protein